MSDSLKFENFQDPERVYPCGEKRVGVPYAKDFYLNHPDVLSSGKTRDVNGVAAEKIAENVKKFDKEKGVLTKAFMAMTGPFSK